MALLMTATELERYLHQGFPNGGVESRVTIEELTETTMRVRFRADGGDLRPGASVSGPVLFTLCDLTAWLLTVAHLGADRDAVTSSASIHYLRRPAAGDLIAEGTLLRLGRRLSVSDILIYSDDDRSKPAVQCTMNYSPI